MSSPNNFSTGQSSTYFLRSGSQEEQYRASTPTGEAFYENIKQTFHRARPFMSKWMRLPENYEQMYQQALDEIQQQDFIVERTVQTVWGIKASRTQP